MDFPISHLFDTAPGKYTSPLKYMTAKNSLSRFELTAIMATVSPLLRSVNLANNSSSPHISSCYRSFLNFIIIKVSLLINVYIVSY